MDEACLVDGPRYRGKPALYDVVVALGADGAAWTPKASERVRASVRGVRDAYGQHAKAYLGASWRGSGPLAVRAQKARVEARWEKMALASDDELAAAIEAALKAKIAEATAAEAAEAAEDKAAEEEGREEDETKGARVIRG